MNLRKVMKTKAVGNSWGRNCAVLVLSGLAVLASVPVQADSLRVLETRNDKLKCKYDPDIGAKTCAVTTGGKYDVVLKVSAATLENNGVDVATLLQTAETDLALSVSLGIGPYQFDGEVSEGSDVQLTAAEASSKWVSQADKWLDADGVKTKTVTVETVKFAVTPDGGVAFRIKGLSLSDENNDYGDSLLADDCSQSGQVAENISLVLGDGEPVDLPVTMKCKVKTTTKHKGDAGDFDLTKVRLTAKLGDASSTP
jgi:hypothetical protein